MGVGAVSATLQVRTISNAVIAQQLAEREAPQVRLWKPFDPITYQTANVSPKDIQALRKQLIGVRAVSTFTWFWAPANGVIFEDRTANPDIQSVSQEYLETSGRKLLQGRFFNTADFENYRSVTVIDNFLAEELFPKRDPIGQRIYMNERPYVVVGVVDTVLRYSREEPEGLMLMTVSLVQALTGRREVDFILIRPERLEDINRVEEQAKQFFQKRFPGYEVRPRTNVRDIVEQKQTLEMVSQALLVVGGIALLVGGVGIANITIASVIERTPEIGLRRALGATRADIMLQFILEGTLLSVIGGAIAIASVHGLTVIVSNTFELPYEFDSQTAVLALGSALGIGISAGFFPALQASKLDPVDALRSQ
jgi:putative ABC transport system permease protein